VDDDTYWQQKCEALEDERDRAMSQLFGLTREYNRLLQYRYPGCVVLECLTYPDPDITSLPLCTAHLAVAAREHARRVEELDRACEPIQDVEEPDFDWPPRYYERQKQLEAQRRSPVVYYIQMNEYIKIGTTTRLRQRLATFSARPKDLLAIEPGGKERERERHLQFRASRVDRGELFAPTPKLLTHIAEARRMFGDPMQFLEPVLD